ncbi:M15 family metallopeptidase [Microbacterium sp. XT11]|uniref:M15 family metallopeptidase n=1 Tax=Microbacterium sp. XT11 TaxID=367477 RepID=UPI000742FA70|nr:M15 family metallopeptidase [Microbacterium sp. XT11]ALX66189.1 peptidase M15 [Microbacterium sp. XT11]
MNTSRSLRQRRLVFLLGTALIAVIAIGTLIVAGQQSSARASSAGPSFTDTELGEDDGLIDEADRVSVFDDTPAVSNLDPALLSALRDAATVAEADGVRIHVNSGWRSPAYQNALLADAVQKYGSAEEAARWVATPERSEHVSGDAVDLGPVAGQDWLSRHGARFGLCQIYENEPWHFELRPAAPANGCPVMYADPTADPRVER